MTIKWTEVNVKIAKIYTYGQVDIVFTVPLIKLSNLTLIDNFTFTIEVQPVNPLMYKQLNNFTWKAISMKGNTLSLQLDFGDPKLISRNGVIKDALRIKILTNDTLV